MKTIQQIPFAALGLGAAFTVLWGVADPVAALAEVKMYTGVGKCAMGDLVSPAQAKNYAREIALQNAREQAGVYLTSYTRTTNTKLSAGEITAISNNITEVVGEVSYTQTPGEVNGVPVVVYTATLQANVDTDGIKKYLERDEKEKAVIVRESNQTRQEINDSLAKIENLNQRYNKAGSDKERESIKRDFNLTDEKLLALQKNEEGMALEYKGDYEGAISSFRQAIRISPTYATPWNNLSTIYNSLGNTEKAIECAHKALDLVPGYATPWANLSSSYIQLKKYQKAIECAKKSLSIDSRYATAWNNLAFAYDGLGDYDKAIEGYRKAIEIDPNNGTYWYNLGNTYSNIDNYDGVLECGRKAVELQPDKAESWMLLAWGLITHRQWGEALEAADKILELDPKNDAWRGIREKIIAEINE